MPIQKIIHGIKKLNDTEKLKANLDMKKHIDELQKLGWKKFWKLNNRFVKMLGIIFGILLLLLFLNGTKVATSIRNDLSWAAWYFFGTTLVFTGLSFYIIKFSIDNKLSDYNTSNFSRAKIKHKGIDWQTAEEPFVKGKK